MLHGVPNYNRWRLKEEPVILHLDKQAPIQTCWEVDQTGGEVCHRFRNQPVPLTGSA